MGRIAAEQEQGVAMKRERSGRLPFSESDLKYASKDGTTGIGAQWRDPTDDLLVGLLGQSYGTTGGPPDYVLNGARAELQRRQIEATQELSELQQRHIDATTQLTDVQRTLLVSIETFNAESGHQADKLIHLTEWIIGLTVVLGIIAALQLMAMFWGRT